MDTSEEYIKIVIMHPAVQFVFLYMLCIEILLLICMESE